LKRDGIQPLLGALAAAVRARAKAKA